MEQLPMPVREAADVLLIRVKETDLYREYNELKRAVTEKPENAALLRRYQELRRHIALGSAAGTACDETEQHDFEKLCVLLFEDETISAYLLKQMQLEQMTAAAVEQLMSLTETEHAAEV